jgi:UDP-glucuronate decarboxylase
VREPLPDVEDVEQIYHLASPASPDHFAVSPIEILETNFLGTKNVLNLAVIRKARVLLASTSGESLRRATVRPDEPAVPNLRRLPEIYGDPQIDCQPETYWGNVNSFGPRSCYDEGKRSLEALAYAFQTSHNVEVRIARIFNAYGPHMQLDDGRAVPNFIAAAMEGTPLTIYGDGSATRCFQHASDCVRGLEALMNSNHKGPVNIGSDREVPVGDIARMITKVVATRMGQAKPTPVNFEPKRQDDPTKRKPDISLAKEVLGWSPQVPLEQGIASTVDWFLATKGIEPVYVN